MLSKLKQWFSNLSEPQFSYVSEETDYPTVEPESVEYNGVDLKFYTTNYKITPENKKKLVSLVQKPEFRDFERYIDWRVNACAHMMKSFLVSGKVDEAKSAASEIDALVKIGQDMQNYWTEVKLMEASDGILLKESQTKKPKVFGEDSISLFAPTDEAERI